MQHISIFLAAMGTMMLFATTITQALKPFIFYIYVKSALKQTLQRSAAKLTTPMTKKTLRSIRVI